MYFCRKTSAARPNFLSGPTADAIPAIARSPD
jgi:hypothetical protein